jgi:hypothetical protein
MLERMKPNTRPHNERAFYRIASTVSLLLLFLGGVTACAAQRESKQTSGAESPDIWEMTIMAGRYGVMLSQAREILGLPEPARKVYDLLSADTRDEARERVMLAHYQVAVASEFFEDMALACGKADVPEAIRALACRHRSGVPAHLRKEAKPDLESLSARNDALGEIIMPWWDTACALAPKAAEDEDPACVME